MKLYYTLRGLPVLLSLVAIGYLLELSNLSEILDRHWIDAEVRGQGLHGEALYLGIGTLATAVGFPRQAIAFMGGYAFGFLGGTALALVATLLGCAASFYYARLLGRRLISHRFSGRIKKMDDFIHEHPFTMTLLIRIRRGCTRRTTTRWFRSASRAACASPPSTTSTRARMGLSPPHRNWTSSWLGPTARPSASSLSTRGSTWRSRR